MNALIWRLHYRQVYFAIGALAALGLLFVITGTVMAHDYQRFQASCHALQNCADAKSILFKGDGAIIDLVNMTVVVPLLLGIFWGVPLVAREFEEGTQSLVWTQGVTRRHWMYSNIAWVFAAAAVWTGALSILVGWWRSPENALDSQFGAFDIQGIVPIAYALFAVALGLAVGSMLRRVLPTIAVTLAACVGLRVLVAFYLRPRFISPTKRIFALASNGGAPKGSWVISSGLIGPGGSFYPGGIDLRAMPATCRDLLAGGAKAVSPCMESHGFRQVVTFQVAGLFWPFQTIEASVFVALAALLVVAAFWVVKRRDA